MSTLAGRRIGRYSTLPWLTIVAAAICLSSAPDIATAQSQYPLTPPSDGVVDVQVSILLVDVFRILDSEQEIEADLFVRLEWEDPRIASPGESLRWLNWEAIWAPTLQPLAPRSLSKLLPEGAEVDENGKAVYTQRYVGTFGASTLLEEFPFDEHDFKFQFIVTTRGAVDPTINSGPIVGQSEQLTIPDWHIQRGGLDVQPIHVSDVIPPVSGFSYTIHAQRNTAHYLIKIIFPLIVIVMVSWTVFWAPPTQMNVQFGFAATSILTVIAYRFALAGQVPPVPYETRLDTFLTGAFTLSFLALIEVVITAQLVYREKTATAERVDQVCRWLFPLLLAGTSMYAFML